MLMVVGTDLPEMVARFQAEEIVPQKEQSAVLLSGKKRKQNPESLSLRREKGSVGQLYDRYRQEILKNASRTLDQVRWTQLPNLNLQALHLAHLTRYPTH